MSKNNLHVLFDDDDILLDAIKKIKEKKIVKKLNKNSAFNKLTELRFR